MTGSMTVRLIIIGVAIAMFVLTFYEALDRNIGFFLDAVYSRLGIVPYDEIARENMKDATIMAICLAIFVGFGYSINRLARKLTG